MTLLVCGTAATVVVASEVTTRVSHPLLKHLGKSATFGPQGPPARDMGHGMGHDMGIAMTAALLHHLGTEETDPRSQAGERFAADTTQHPARRIDALGAIALGGCRNLPEVMFGFSPARRAALSRALANLADVDGAEEAGAGYVQFLEDAMTLHEVRDAPPPGSVLDRSVLLNAFAWIVPPGVRARAFLCLQQNR